MQLIHCVVDDTLSQAMPDLRQTLLQFIDVMNLISVCLHVTQRVHKQFDFVTCPWSFAYGRINRPTVVNNNSLIIMFIWLILSTIWQNGDIVLDTPEFCYFWYCFSQGSVATLCRCGRKYDICLVVNLLVNPTVKKIRQSVNIYERISSGARFYGPRCISGNGASNN